MKRTYEKIYKGLKFNCITVLDDTITKIDGVRYNLCKCDCGNERYINRTTLLTRAIQDCGCKKYTYDKYIGKRYGKLVVQSVEIVKRSPKTSITLCHCKCDCGNENDVSAGALEAGRVSSCGCVHKFNYDKYIGKTYHGNEILEFVDKDKKQVLCKCACGNRFICCVFELTAQKKPIMCCGKCGENIGTPFKVHMNTSKERLRNIYFGMKYRCYNPKAKSYKSYGGRGVTICDEWLKGYKYFEEWALNNGYSKELTIDRIDVNGNYEPNNCRWITNSEQQSNKRNTKKYEYNGGIYSLSQIAKLVNIPITTLRSRVNILGWDFEKAISTPTRGVK